VRIAQIAPCWITVPPAGYGGIELVVSLLTDELFERGHEVTLFASGGSETKADLVSYYETPPGTAALVGDPLAELPHLLHAYSRAAEFDVIHDHSAPLGCSIGAQISRPPVVHTIHGPLFDGRPKEVYPLIAGRVHLVSISDFQRNGLPDIPYAGTVYNGIDVKAYEVSPTKDEYLLFLGRMSPDKGAHLAVEAAKRLGRKLIIATKMVEPMELAYYDGTVKPLLTGEEEILGEISFAEKVRLYSRAYCTLMPIQWPEPFGLVMTESMACGTPVVAYHNGAVPEIIDHEETGFIVEDFEAFVAAIGRASAIDPQACRAAVEERFSTGAMVDGYENLYRGLATG
jgi:glycosyltransferase involved in cell wall biosynthesis